MRKYFSRTVHQLQKGFTLMEMMIVILIISIILGIGIPIVSHVMQDSDTEEFVSNAKLVEEAANLYYRDYGTYPMTDKSYKLGTKVALADTNTSKNNPFVTSVKAATTVTEISEISQKIILSRLVENGVTNAKDVLATLAANGKIKSLDYSELAEYSKVKLDDNGAKEFVIIDLVDEADITSGKYGVYQNDIAGYVFSEDTRSKSTGVYYSGAYELTDDELAKLDDTIEKLDTVDVTKLKDGDLFPYGFKLSNVKGNNDGTVNIGLSWTNRLADKDNSLDTYKGFTVTEFEVTYFEPDGTKKVVTTTDLNETLKGLPTGETHIYLKGTEIKYAGKVVDKETGYISILGNHVTNIDTDNDSIDTNELITGAGDGMTNPLCSTCNLDEIIGGPQFDVVETLYKEIKEDTDFNKDKVEVVKEGFKIKGLSKGERIVLRELKKSGNTYSYDSNRTALFSVKADGEVLIPKSPYLQADYQKNPYSKYVYIIEMYKNAIEKDSTKTAPTHAVELFYAQ